MCLQTNNVDDNGLIEGKWEGSFEDGTSPFAWIGSTPIFEEFYNTQMPVKYGQCWVFSGVIVTSKLYYNRGRVLQRRHLRFCMYNDF